ncbi:MAG: peptidase M48 [Desulfobacterales bacterium]|nr:MAG: peptidase M48 [Desulfobacterales bacterium]
MATAEPTFQAQGYHQSLPKEKISGTLYLSSQMLMFQSGTYRVSLPLAGIKFKVGGASNRLLFISHPSVQDWILSTNDLTILKSSFLQNIPATKQQCVKARNKRLLHSGIVVACLLAIIVIPLGLLAKMDWISQQIAKKIPVTWERAIGRTTYEQMLTGQSRLQTARGLAALRNLVQPLLAVVPSNTYDFEIVVVDTPDVNAFSLPGGFIVINAGLILAADSADEVLGVLAHEMVHVLEQHGIRNMINTSGLFMVVNVFFGDTKGMLALLTDAAPVLINQSYSREFEAEADEKGLRLLEKADINPQGLIRFFEKLIALEQASKTTIKEQHSQELLEKVQGFLRSHPATAERMNRLQEQIGAVNTTYHNDTKAFMVLKTEVNKLVTNNEDTL